MYLYRVGRNFLAKSFFEIEPKGKKMCTYMVGGEKIDKLKSL